MTLLPDIHPTKWPDDQMLEAAWGIIANAFEGDWDRASDEWRKAAQNWADAYFKVEKCQPREIEEALSK